MTKQKKQIKRLPNKPKGSKAEVTMQSIRLTKSLNRNFKSAAKRRGITFNRWAVDHLTAALAKEKETDTAAINQKERETNGGIQIQAD